MKTPSLLAVLAVLAISLVHGRAEAPPLTTAVFNFQAAGEKLANKGADVALLLGAQLSAAPNVVLIERQELQKALGEQELSLSGTVSPDTAAKLGSLTGAKVLITGRIFEAGGKSYIVVKIIGTETSRVFGEVVSFEDPAALDKAVTELAGKVVGVLNVQGASLVAPIEAPGAWLERLKQKTQGKKLPSVVVSVPEQHLSHPVIDPAVETELKLTLQQLGFEVLDPAATNKTADVKITGEAFSELAGTRANLVSMPRPRGAQGAARVGRQAVVRRPADGCRGGSGGKHRGQIRPPKRGAEAGRPPRAEDFTALIFAVRRLQSGEPCESPVGKLYATGRKSR
ncbi:MAG: CsgG/HfaB family protein [Chthoniobacter sp.]